MSPYDPETLREAAALAEPPRDPQWLEDLNAEYAVIRVGGKVKVMYEETETDDDGFRKSKQVFLNAHDFQVFMKNHKVTHNGKLMGVADLWLEHPSRRTYQGLGMWPPPLITPPGRYNLWRGFGIEPRPGKWPLLREHIDLLAGYDPLCTDYFHRWIAFGLQRPAEKLEVVVLLIGEEQGGGKGTLGHLLRRIYGVHGLYVTRKEHIIGRFNAHLANGLFCFVDEAFFGGDRAAAAHLKGLITDTVMPVEPKHVDLFFVPNRLRMLVASNERHAMHTEMGDRRVAAFEPAWPWETQHERLAYFNRLHHEIQHGGAGAFLRDMLAMDLTGFDPREIPATLLRAEQQTSSLRGTAAWWFDMLSQGGMPWYGGAGDNQRAIDAVVPVAKPYLYQAYIDWAKERKPYEYKIDNDTQFWTTLRKLVKVGDGGRPAGEAGRARLVTLPPLTEARSQFEQNNKLGICLPWEPASRGVPLARSRFR